MRLPAPRPVTAQLQHHSTLLLVALDPVQGAGWEVHGPARLPELQWGLPSPLTLPLCQAQPHHHRWPHHRAVRASAFVSAAVQLRAERVRRPHLWALVAGGSSCARRRCCWCRRRCCSWHCLCCMPCPGRSLPGACRLGRVFVGGTLPASPWPAGFTGRCPGDLPWSPPPEPAPPPSAQADHSATGPSLPAATRRC